MSRKEKIMRNQILFILSVSALLIYPLSLSTQNSTSGDQDVTPDFDGDGQLILPRAYSGKKQKRGDFLLEARLVLSL